MSEGGFNFNKASVIVEKGETVIIEPAVGAEINEADKRLAVLSQKISSGLVLLQGRLEAKAVKTIETVVKKRIYTAITVSSLLAMMSGSGVAKVTTGEVLEKVNERERIVLVEDRQPEEVRSPLEPVTLPATPELPETKTEVAKEEKPTLVATIVLPTLEIKPSPTVEVEATKTLTPTQPIVKTAEAIPVKSEGMVSVDLTKEDIDFLASHEITRGDTEKKIIGLTLDAGASSEFWPVIREALKKNNVKVTVFLTADWITKNPQQVKEMVEMGLEIGNHSSTHPHFTQLTDEQIKTEVINCQKSLDGVVGVHVPVSFFRFPFGERDSRTLRLLAEMGLQSVFWSDGGDSGGWQNIGEDAIIKRLTAGTREGQIFVLHIGSDQDAAVLSGYLESVQKNGYQIKPISWTVARKDTPPSIRKIKENNAGVTGYFPLPELGRKAPEARPTLATEERKTPLSEVLTETTTEFSEPEMRGVRKLKVLSPAELREKVLKGEIFFQNNHPVVIEEAEFLQHWASYPEKTREALLNAYAEGVIGGIEKQYGKNSPLIVALETGHLSVAAAGKTTQDTGTAAVLAEGGKIAEKSVNFQLSRMIAKKIVTSYPAWTAVLNSGEEGFPIEQIATFKGNEFDIRVLDAVLVQRPVWEKLASGKTKMVRIAVHFNGAGGNPRGGMIIPPIEGEFREESLKLSRLIALSLQSNVSAVTPGAYTAEVRELDEKKDPYPQTDVASDDQKLVIDAIGGRISAEIALEQVRCKANRYMIRLAAMKKGIILGPIGSVINS